jgi:methyltransferase (TIGR00027 family)
MGAAHARAEHCRLDPEPWILDDRLAGELIPSDVRERFEAGRSRLPAELKSVVRAHFPVRARVAEDAAVAGLAEGRGDYVILGAGLDTFAWRHKQAGEFTVWEIDHPDTQTWKRAQLAALGIAEPDNVRFIAADLSVTSLTELDLPNNASWNWLGVTVYLDKATTAKTLEAIAAISESAVVAAEFALTLDHCDELGRAWRELTGRFSGSVGEQHVSLFSPEEATKLVEGAGLRAAEVLQAEQLAERYLRDQPQLCVARANTYVVARLDRAT